MPDIGLGGDERHRHLIAQLATAQLGFQDEQEFVGRAEAGGTLDCADHHRSGLGSQLLERVLGVRGMVHMADRLGIAVRTQAGDLVEGKLRTCRDHQVIVADRRAVAELNAVFGRMNAPHALGEQANALALHDLHQIDLDLVTLAPADRNPGIRWHEVVHRTLRHHGQPIFLSQLG